MTFITLEFYVEIGPTPWNTNHIRPYYAGKQISYLRGANAQKLRVESINNIQSQPHLILLTATQYTHSVCFGKIISNSFNTNNINLYLLTKQHFMVFRKSVSTPLNQGMLAHFHPAWLCQRTAYDVPCGVLLHFQFTPNFLRSLALLYAILLLDYCRSCWPRSCFWPAAGNVWASPLPRPCSTPWACRVGWAASLAWPRYWVALG